MSESARRHRDERVSHALGFSLLAGLVAALDYWTYRVLSSDDLVGSVCILTASYVASSLALWLLCSVARAVRLHRLRKADDARRRQPQSSRPDQVPERRGLGFERGVAAHLPGANVDRRGRPQDANVDQHGRRQRHPRTQQRGCAGRGPRPRRASA
jgi:hypothetical protein